jgi:integrase
MSVTVQIYFDNRSIRKKTGTFPFKLKVYNGVSKYYPTIYGLSQAEKDKLTAPRLGAELQKVKSKLQEIEWTATEAVKGMDPFSYEEFERDYIKDNPLFIQTRVKAKPIAQAHKDFDFTPFYKKYPILRETPEPGTIGEVYLSIIRKKLIRGKISTAMTYQQSYISLVKFGGNVRFSAITEDYLYLYEDWMKNQTGKRVEGNSKTTIGIYLKNLRRAFNVADSIKIIRRDKCYPFGRDKYIIPNSRNIKKHLEPDEIHQIYNYPCDPEMPWLTKARAFWFYMYFGNGMNPKDMLLLKFRDIKGEFLEFERAKTGETLREDPPKIAVFLNEDMLQTMAEYGNKDKSPENYIFPFFEPNMTPLRQHVIKELFIKFVNKWMAYILKQLGINKKATTYVARHTYATVRRRGGASVDDIRDELGQVDATTTRRYIGSLASEQTRSNAKQLEAFKKRDKSEEAA